MLALCRGVEHRKIVMRSSIRLILYSKPGCHLCEGLQEKLDCIESLDLDLEIRDITTRDEWFQAFQYTIPVMFYVPDQGNEEEGELNRLIPVDRPSPRASVSQVEKLVRRAIARINGEETNLEGRSGT